MLATILKADRLISIIIHIMKFTVRWRKIFLVVVITIISSSCETKSKKKLKTHSLDGKSFVPVINGKKEVKNYAISKYHDGITLIKDDIFYTEWLNDEGVVRSKMMFDQKLDPLELNNIVNDPNNKTKVNELSEFLHNNWGNSFFNKNQPE